MEDHVPSRPEPRPDRSVADGRDARARVFGAPGRAATHKGSERAYQILETAKDILVEFGFSGLTYRAIARKAAIPIGNITYYFPSKDRLLVALAEHLFDRWENRFEKQLSGKLLTRAETFRYSIRYMIEENKRPKTCSLLMDMWAMANHHPNVAKMMTVFYQRMQNHIVRMLANLNPHLTIRQQQLRAGLIAAQIEGLMVLLAPSRPHVERLAGLEDAAVEQSIRIALAI